jgi:hypothetical protein
VILPLNGVLREERACKIGELLAVGALRKNRDYMQTRIFAWQYMTKVVLIFLLG